MHQNDMQVLVFPKYRTKIALNLYFIFWPRYYIYNIFLSFYNSNLFIYIITYITIIYHDMWQEIWIILRMIWNEIYEFSLFWFDGRCRKLIKWRISKSSDPSVDQNYWTLRICPLRHFFLYPNFRKAFRSTSP